MKHSVKFKGKEEPVIMMDDNQVGHFFMEDGKIKVKLYVMDTYAGAIAHKSLRCSFDKISEAKKFIKENLLDLHKLYGLSSI